MLQQILKVNSELGHMNKIGENVVWLSVLCPGRGPLTSFEQSNFHSCKWRSTRTVAGREWTKFLSATSRKKEFRFKKINRTFFSK